MSIAQQYPGRPSGGIDRLLQRVVGIEQRVRDMRSNLLKNAGIHVVPGGLSIEGNLAVPNGSISNDALENPIEIADLLVNADGFTVGPTESVVATGTIPIPAGYSRALVKATGMMFVYNGGATYSYLRSRVYINSPVVTSWSRKLLAPLPDSGGSAALTVDHQWRMADLNGGNITIEQRGSSDYASVTDASNGATVTAFALFLR